MAIAGCGSGLIVIVELIRRGQLKERYALLWLFAGIILLIFSLSRGLLEYVAALVGIYYPPSLLFLPAYLTLNNCILLGSFLPAPVMNMFGI
jgi:hypothetical protein